MEVFVFLCTGVYVVGGEGGVDVGEGGGRKSRGYWFVCSYMPNTL